MTLRHQRRLSQVAAADEQSSDTVTTSLLSVYPRAVSVKVTSLNSPDQVRLKPQTSGDLVRHSVH